MVLASTPKRNHHGVGYQLHDQKRNGWTQKENRETRSYLAFPLLNWTFKSGGYINASPFGEDEDMITPFRTLTINVITEDEEMVEIAPPDIYPCSSDFELDN